MAESRLWNSEWGSAADELLYLVKCKLSLRVEWNVRQLGLCGESLNHVLSVQQRWKESASS